MHFTHHSGTVESHIAAPVDQFQLRALLKGLHCIFTYTIDSYKKIKVQH